MNLLFILFFPLLIGAYLLIAKPKHAFIISLSATILEAIATGFLLYKINETLLPITFIQDWISEVGIQFSLKADGISGILIGLCALLLPFIIGSTVKTEKANHAQYQGLMLLMQSAMMGAFLAKDAFLFYFFFHLHQFLQHLPIQDYYLFLKTQLSLLIPNLR